MDCCINDADTNMEKDKIGSIPYKELDSIGVSTKAAEDPWEAQKLHHPLELSRVGVKELGLYIPQQPDVLEVHTKDHNVIFTRLPKMEE